LPIALTLVVAGIGIAYGLNVIGDTKEDMCDSNYDDGACRICNNASAATYNSTSNQCENVSSTSADAYTLDQSAEFNATQDAISGISKLPEKMPIIVTVIVAAILIGILVRYLMVRYQ